MWLDVAERGQEVTPSCLVLEGGEDEAWHQGGGVEAYKVGAYRFQSFFFYVGGHCF